MVAPDVALPATGSSLIASLVAWHEGRGGMPVGAFATPFGTVACTSACAMARRDRATPPAGRNKGWGGIRRGAWVGAETPEHRRQSRQRRDHPPEAL